MSMSGPLKSGPLIDCQKRPPQEFSPKAKISFNYFFGGMYVEKVLCGPNSARSPFSKKMRSIFFDRLSGPLKSGPLRRSKRGGQMPAPLFF